MRVLGMPLPFYKSATLLLGFGLSPYVLARLWKIRPDVIHVAFPGADSGPPCEILIDAYKIDRPNASSRAIGTGAVGGHCRRRSTTVCRRQPC